MIEREQIENTSWFRTSGYGEFQSHYMDLPAGRMHYIDENPSSRQTVVMIHGTPSWSFEYRHWIHGLRRSVRCLAPDHMGFGLSDRPAEWDYSLLSHSANLMRWASNLDVPKYTLVLHDFGGPVGIPLLLADWDRIDRVVILNSWLWSFDRVDMKAAQKLKWIKSPLMKFLYMKLNFSAQMMVKMSWGKHRKLSRSTHDGYRKMFPNAESRRGTWAFAEAVVDSADYLKVLEKNLGDRMALSPKPVMILWGMADGFVTTPNLERWEHLLKPVKTVRLEGVGHFPQDEAFERTLPELAAFLEMKRAP